jgi:hypothetical protein
MTGDTLELMDEWGPEKVVCVSDRESGMRGVLVMANAGGIVAAAHSMDARRAPFSVDPTDVFAMISAKMRANAETVVLASRARDIAPHAARPADRRGPGPRRDAAARPYPCLRRRP